MRKTLLMCLACLLGTASAQAQITEATTFQMYEIAYKGMPITVDGNLDDWGDAQFIFVSQDKVNFNKANGNPAIQGRPESPADFSGYFAMKMDDEAIYFAIKVRDEGTPMIETPATANLAFDYDHLSVYLGLYDIGDLPASPHVEGAGQFQFFKPRDTPQVGDTITSGRSYRIAPGHDNTQTTLGPDYQMLVRALPYAGGVATGADVQAYSGGLVDTTIANTTVATQLFDDETGYVLEWKVPFASLAGQISKPSREYKLFSWPLFEPADGKVIVFDADLTDKDAGDQGLNRYLRLGDKPALWRDSFNWMMRGKIVDLSIPANNAPATRYYADYAPQQNVTIDGDMADWRDAWFIGLSQDKLNFLMANGNPIQGVPESPADFSGYIALKLDDENLYVAAIVRDEGTPLLDTPATPNLAFDYDHLSLYLGLYDIGNQSGSPHTETGINIYSPTDTLESSVRSYRVKPGTDNTLSTLGADYQMLIRALPYAGVVMDDDVQTYNGGLVDTTIQNTTAATRLFADETGYYLEWKVPLASLSGEIAKQIGGAYQLSDMQWPMYQPTPGDVFVFDADLTDKDAGDQGLNRYLRIGNKPALWRDSFSWSQRALVTGGQFVFTAIEEVDEIPVLAGNTMLGKSYPNPTTGAMRIPFMLPQAQHARLSIYNVLGQEVAVLVDGMLESGPKEATFDASSLPAGTYLYRLSTPSKAETSLMTLVK